MAVGLLLSAPRTWMFRLEDLSSHVQPLSRAKRRAKRQARKARTLASPTAPLLVPWFFLTADDDGGWKENVCQCAGVWDIETDL